MSDNFHQSVNGGTGANHIMLGHGDAIWFSDGDGKPATPPQNVEVATRHRECRHRRRDRESESRPGTNNWYTEDGYGGGSVRRTSYGGGSYSDCADPTQPGVGPIVNYLQSLPRPIDPRCERATTTCSTTTTPATSATATTPSPTPTPTIRRSPFRRPRRPASATRLLAANISWKYYGDSGTTTSPIRTS